MARAGEAGLRLLVTVRGRLSRAERSMVGGPGRRESFHWRGHSCSRRLIGGEQQLLLPLLLPGVDADLLDLGPVLLLLPPTPRLLADPPLLPQSCS